jgi:3-deoxy-manno-octulosonate cytidylyltransferase (CMP-KDO synthetase)
MSSYLILIPARYGSTRFPGKPLAKINNIPMIQYVIENCKKTGFDYAVVTDNDQIETFIKSIDERVVRIDEDVPTGSERIALAYTKFFSDKNYKLIINVQGDEPLLKAETIQKIALSHEKNDADIFTGINERSSTEDDFHNPNIVKCVYAKETKSCLYFSRASLPFSRSSKEYSWYQHIGIYSYKPKALLKFVELPMSEHETLEKLEQLRALDNGLTVGAEIINVTLIGVDTQEDISRVENTLMEKTGD